MGFHGIHYGLMGFNGIYKLRNLIRHGGATACLVVSTIFYDHIWDDDLTKGLSSQD
jgi:hypothetical protein